MGCWNVIVIDSKTKNNTYEILFYMLLLYLFSRTTPIPTTLTLRWLTQWAQFWRARIEYVR